MRTLLIYGCLTAGLAAGQGVITTVAGKDRVYPGKPLPALDAPIGLTTAVAVDQKGNVYFSDADTSLVLKLDKSGIVTVVAGNGFNSSTGTGGPAASALLNHPGGVAVDATGNLFIADNDNNRIRKVTPDGTIRTVAGDGSRGFSGDGEPASLAALNLRGGTGFLPNHGLAVDGAGNLFIADTNNNRVRKVAPDGTISTVAGNGESRFSGDGVPATEAAVPHPVGLAVDATGNVFIADASNRIRRVTTSSSSAFVTDTAQVGTITTVAGNGSPVLRQPGGVAVDGAGNLYIADTFNRRIRMVTSDGNLTTVAGNGNPSFSGDGQAAVLADLYRPEDAAVDAAGNLFIADTNNNRVRKVTPEGTITTVAGNGTVGAGKVPPTPAKTAGSPHMRKRSADNSAVLPYNPILVRLN